MDEAIRVPPTATAPGLLLRPWAEDDIPALLMAHQDPVMHRWLRHPVTSAEQAREIIAKHEAARRAGTSFSFAVQVIDAGGGAGDPVGGVSVRGLGDDTARGEVGYWTAPRARGQGIAPHALSAVCAWAFQLPRLRPLDGLELIHAIGNQASCRVAAKAGVRGHVRRLEQREQLVPFRRGHRCVMRGQRCGQLDRQLPVLAVW